MVVPFMCRLSESRLPGGPGVSPEPAPTKAGSYKRSKRLRLAGYPFNLQSGIKINSCGSLALNALTDFPESAGRTDILFQLLTPDGKDAS